MGLLFRQAFSCFILAGFAVGVTGCHNASRKSTTPGADSAPEAAGNDGSVLTGDIVANLDSSIPSTADVAASLDNRVPLTADMAASPDSRVPFTADVAANLDNRSADVAASPDSRVPFTADVPAQDGRQGDAPAIQDSSVSPPADASRDSQTSGEWLDNAGVCRSNQIPTFTQPCQKTFQDAVTSGASGGMAKSGWCQDMLVWISYGTPSIGCGYDSTGSTLVARYLGDDSSSYCNRTSYSVSTPNWPSSCVPTPVDAGSDAR
jgi:hypothetical protein